MRLSSRLFATFTVLFLALGAAGGCASHTTNAAVNQDDPANPEQGIDHCVPTTVALPNGDSALICSLDYEISHDPGNDHVTIIIQNGWVIVYGTNTTVEDNDTETGDDADNDGDAEAKKKEEPPKQDKPAGAKQERIARHPPFPSDIRLFFGIGKGNAAIIRYTSDDGAVPELAVRHPKATQPHKLGRDKTLKSKDGLFQEINEPLNLKKPDVQKIRELLKKH